MMPPIPKHEIVRLLSQALPGDITVMRIDPKSVATEKSRLLGNFVQEVKKSLGSAKGFILVAIRG